MRPSLTPGRWALTVKLHYFGASETSNKVRVDGLSLGEVRAQIQILKSEKTSNTFTAFKTIVNILKYLHFKCVCTA